MVAAAVLLFLVMDPLGNIPFFLAALKHVDPARQNLVIRRELFIAFVVMVIFLFAGQSLLAAMRISEPALSISGGLILFLIAVRMVFPTPERPLQEEVDDEPFLVPLAIPYVAGPSVLAVELLLMSREPHRWLEWLGAVTVAWLGVAVVVSLGAKLRHILGQKGLTALERLMGMVLVAIAVQMFLTGVERFVLQMQPRAAV
ncbi:MAG: MarC family protein [Gemmata sp.]|mgnify:FL=1